MARICRIGVVLAAGRGGRMDGTKQLKLWRSADGPKPLVCAAYDAIRPICDEMIVVLDHEAEAVAAALGDRTFHRATSSADQPMFESIRAGLRMAVELDAAAAVVLQPGDHPEVAQSTLDAIHAASQKHPEVAIIPEHNGRGGHPAIIPPSVAAQILKADCPRGLGQFWRDHPELRRRIPVDDLTMLLDIDTPADLP
jgi:CTP:molybdopterin cytidylyltransferase MocA